MPLTLAELLDDLGRHIETEIARLPASVSRAIADENSPFSTLEVLRILAQPERATELLGLSETHSQSQSSARAA